MGERLERLRQAYEDGLFSSLDFLKQLLELARDAAAAERQVVPTDQTDKGKAALTELFNGVKDEKTPIIVERIVTDIDNIVKYLRFDGWKGSSDALKEVKLAVKEILVSTYRIRDK